MVSARSVDGLGGGRPCSPGVIGRVVTGDRSRHPAVFVMEDQAVVKRRRVAAKTRVTHERVNDIGDPYASRIDGRGHLANINGQGRRLEWKSGRRADPYQPVRMSSPYLDTDRRFVSCSPNRSTPNRRCTSHLTPADLEKNSTKCAGIPAHRPCVNYGLDGPGSLPVSHPTYSRSPTS